MEELSPGSVDLIVTSPPYPMIEMWDASFDSTDPGIGEALHAADGKTAFERMHLVLDNVWSRCSETLREGGFLCINVGDATRTLGGDFRLYSNHARIAESCRRLDLRALPAVLWGKQTNAPNKFMGSGMLPAGAYVTLEHEYILIFRKGGKRTFSSKEEIERRRESAYFWEERNQWFSDRWDFKGERQRINGSETGRRSGAFPIELAYRLVAMYSVAGDTVVDPFLGTGTSTLASIALGRSSVGYDQDPAIIEYAKDRVKSDWPLLSALNSERLRRHIEFITNLSTSGREARHRNRAYGFPVVTDQETEIRLTEPVDLRKMGETEFVARHRPLLPSWTHSVQGNFKSKAVQPTLSVWQ